MLAVAKRLDPVAETIRVNLVKFREEAGLSQADAANESGVPVDNLRRYERGGAGVDALVLKLLADAYGHQVDDFYMENPPPAKLDERPVFFLRTRGGIEVDEAVYRDLVEQVQAANQRLRESKRRRSRSSR